MKKLFLFLFAFVMMCSVAMASDTQGYRGFVYANYLGGNDGVYTGWNDNGGGFYTTHGYQINPRIFVGGGLGVQVHSMNNFNDTAVFVPIYADARFDFPSSGTVTPFVELKIGYSAGDDYNGFHGSSLFGLKFNSGKRVKFNTFLGYTAQKYEYTTIFTYNGGALSVTDHAFDHNFVLGLGIEF